MCINSTLKTPRQTNNRRFILFYFSERFRYSEIQKTTELSSLSFAFLCQRFSEADHRRQNRSRVQPDRKIVGVISVIGRYINILISAVFRVVLLLRAQNRRRHLVHAQIRAPRRFAVEFFAQRRRRLYIFIVDPRKY